MLRSRIGLLAAALALLVASQAAATQVQFDPKLNTVKIGDAVGNTIDLGPPYADAAHRVITKTSLAANTNTVICPAVVSPALPTATEIYFTTAGVGIGFNGQTLTTAAPGTATTTPDEAIGTAGTLYTFVIPPTNAVTAYGAAGVVVCVQHLR